MKNRFLRGLMAVAFMAFPTGIVVAQGTDADRVAKTDTATADADDKPVDEGASGSDEADESAHALSSDGKPRKARSTNFWMDQKMRLSSKALQSLAVGDFDEMAASAEFMLGLNKIESFWRRGKAVGEYRAQLDQFALANRRLIRAARKENIEAATLAFNQLTVSCVSCHQHLRDGAKK